MRFQFPLIGVDGWCPGNDTCLVCGVSLARPPERIRIFIGMNTDTPPDQKRGVNFDCYWYGPEQPGRNDGGLRGVRVFADSDDEEKVIEFCSANCLREFFNAIAAGLD